MKITTRLVTSILFFSFINLLHAAKSPDSVFFTKLFRTFAIERSSNPQEKVYLQTDKPYYNAGEDIWFKGYLVNGTTHFPNSLSNYIYVELIDKSDSVITRVKLRKDSLGFFGNFKLKPEIPAGNYALRAYTYWMENASDDFFFKKYIYIGNNIDDNVASKISYGNSENGKIPVSITFVNASKTPIKGKKVSIRQNWKYNGRKTFSLTTNADGKISWQLPIDSIDHTSKIISISIAETDLKYKTNFYVPEFSTDFDVQFFPESGTLLSDNLQTVAFKSIGTNGLSVEVSGKVFNNKNEEITEFTSTNKGMGKFVLEAITGETYYALIKSDAGVEKRFDLPAQQAKGAAIHIGFNKNKLLYEVVNHTDLPTSALYLIVHSRGLIQVVQPLKNTEGHIDESQLPSGIVSFSVIDTLGNTYCERLAFILNFNLPEIKMQTDKPVYGKRELVKLDLNVKSLLDKPTSGSYAISVTDSKTVKPDSLNDNILSYLLLSSDIKGFIEEPTSYFNDNFISTLEKLDVLMLTQGWRRYSTASLVKGNNSQPKFYMEAGQTLSGKVLNLFNKPSVKCDVSLLSGYKSIFKMTKTDSVGNYLIDGIEFPDSTNFILKARKKKAFGDVEVIPDADVFPKADMFFPTPKFDKGMPPKDYFMQSKEKYYTEGGMRVINLDEVTVTAQKKSTNSDSDEYYTGMADIDLTSTDLDKFQGMSIMTVFQTIPGVFVQGDNISIRGSRDNPMILVDNMEIQDLDEIRYLTTNDLDDISVFKGADAAIFGSRGGNGVITITLKKGVTLKTSTPISVATITPLGYQKPTEFYMPKYDVDSIRMSPKADLRTTIYWNPKLITDASGTIHVKFFTADKANDYSVVLEGITNEGEICRFVGILKRDDK